MVRRVGGYLGCHSRVTPFAVAKEAYARNKIIGTTAKCKEYQKAPRSDSNAGPVSFLNTSTAKKYISQPDANSFQTDHGLPQFPTRSSVG